MNGIILITIMIAFFGFYALSVNGRTRKSSEKHNYKLLHQAEAGSTKRMFKRKTDLSKDVRVDMANIPISSDLEYFVVRNNCMKAKGICAGDIIGVKMLNEKSILNDDKNRDRILLIYLDDDNFKGYKIREQGEFIVDSNAYDTYHYSKGVRTRSSRPHGLNAIKGVVVEVYGKTYVEAAA